MHTNPYHIGFEPPNVTLERLSGGDVNEDVFTVEEHLSGDNRYTVVVAIEDPRLADNGNYRLVVSNARGPSVLALQVAVQGKCFTHSIICVCRVISLHVHVIGLKELVQESSAPETQVTVVVQHMHVHVYVCSLYMMCTT